MKTIRVLLAEDHETVRQGLSALLARRPTWRSSAKRATAAWPSNGRALQPDVVVLDLSMPEMNGLAATREIKERDAAVAVVALTRHTDDAYVQELLSAGASGYVLKRSPSRSC